MCFNMLIVLFSMFLYLLWYFDCIVVYVSWLIVFDFDRL